MLLRLQPCLPRYSTPNPKNIHGNVLISSLLGSRLIETFDVNFRRLAVSHQLQSFHWRSLTRFPKLTEGRRRGGERKATLSKSVKIQGINYVKWRNMGTWLLLWVRNILICRCPPAASPWHPTSIYDHLQKYINASKRERSRPQQGHPC